MVREIVLASPPPPPPAPPVQQQMQESVPQLQLAVEGDGVAIAVSDVEMPETVEESLQLRAPEMRNTNIDWNLDLAVDWSAYGLDELDGMPSLLSSLRVEFPRSLTSRGIRSALVRLDVFIDESGRVSLISILENPYPELQSAIQRVVRNARFSVPQKGGQPVRARFIWPVEFTNS